MAINDLTGKIIGSAIEVHKILGPGLLESAYEECLAYELKELNILYQRQKELPVICKNEQLDCGYRLDFIIENKLVLELKSCDSLQAIHEAQLLTYLKLSNIQFGLLINFNVPILKAGIKRMILNTS